jgi:hypothetical protein
MLEHLVNVPTVIGRYRVPEVANWLSEQCCVAGFPDDDIKVPPWMSTGTSDARPFRVG